ncbi:MAG: hypothetical protein QOI75_4782, partial [Pseudonocardiales bacterium]|nr:hypothetical protein [Pseudonocardiales bacterium]
MSGEQPAGSASAGSASASDSAGSASGSAESAPLELTPAAQRNIPVFDDLPIPPDSANLREGPDLHPLCTPLLPLIGVWRGEGEVAYPTIGDPKNFGQQIVFAHDGRPFVSYTSQAWLLDGPGGKVVRPA